MKTYAPKGLHGADLRSLLADLHATPAEIAKFLRVTERSVFRWLAEDSAPFVVLAALWHETPLGRETAHIDTGNALNIQRGLARAHGDALKNETRRLVRVLSISESGAANSPLFDGPDYLAPVAPLRFHPRLEPRHLTDYKRRENGPGHGQNGFICDGVELG